MDVGLALPQYDYPAAGECPLRWSTVVSWARRAEACGFSSLWLSDHLFLSLERYGGPPEQCEGLDPLTGLAGLARVTTSARLGTLVLCAQLRPPGVLAKALSTLDVLSGGRLVVGIGAGWQEAEYRAAGVPFESPGRRIEQLAEAITILKGAMAGGPFSFSGRHYSVEALRCRPPAPQVPGPPVWVGGRGDRLLGVVARHAEGWNASGWHGTLAEYRARSTALERACEGAGRDPSEITRSVNRTVLVGEDDADLRRRWERLRDGAPPGVLAGTSLDQFRRGRLVGTVDQVREQAAAWAHAGVSTLIVGPGALPFAMTDIGDLDLLASAFT